MRDLRALSLYRPWSALIAHGHKDIENRTWNTAYRGPLLIHSSKTWDATAVNTAGQIHELPGFPWRERDHPTGIVGLVEVIDVCTASRYGRRCSSGPWAMPGEVHRRLARAYPFMDPIPCPGRQQLWTPPADVWPAIEGAIAALDPLSTEEGTP